MAILLSSLTLSKFGLERTFRIAKEAGFDGLDVLITTISDTYDQKYLEELQAEYKFPIKAFTLQSGASIKDISRTIELAEKLGVKYVTIYPPQLMDLSKSKWIKGLIPLAFKEHRVYLSIINTPSETILGIIPKYSMSSLMELRKIPNVTLDTSNLVSKKEDLIRTLDMLAKNIKHIHLSNVHQGRDHYLLDEGVLPIESFLTKLSELDYKYNITLKIKGSYLTEDDVEILTMELSKMRKFIDKYYKK